MGGVSRDQQRLNRSLTSVLEDMERLPIDIVVFTIRILVPLMDALLA